VNERFVAQGEHDETSLSLFTDDAAMLLDRKIHEGPAAVWPTRAE
jgi:hypothetical protein